MIMMRILAIAALVACGTDEGSMGVDSPSEECVERAPNPFRTRFEGTGFASFETRTVQVVTSIGLTDGSSIICRAATRTTVVDGAFVARTDNRRDDAVYPRVGAYVDVDSDAECTAEVDLIWTQLTAAPPPEQEDTITLSLESFARKPDAEGCALLR